MRAEPNPESPNSDESPSQKQDPLERRRLQNRLSQRNHRRKIRDRIAKLQERVIANELKAAAALNGWDQTCVPSPLGTPRYGPHQDASLISSRDPSPLVTDPSTPFLLPYTMPPTPPWSNEWPASQYPAGLPGDPAFFMDGDFMGDAAYPGSSLTHLMNNVDLPLSCNGPRRGEIHEVNPGGGSFSSEPFPSTPSNQPLYYVTTETALPQILQVLNTVSPQSNIIVLVPDSATPATANVVSVPALLGNNSLENIPQPQTNTSVPACQCQTQSLQTAPQMVSRTWQTPGSYLAGCQPCKQSATVKPFPAMRL